MTGLAALLVACMAAGCSATTDTVADPDLVAHLRLDGNGRGTVGRSPAVIYGATPPEGVDGQPSSALVFNGEVDYLEILRPDGVSFDLRKESFSILVWVRSESQGRARLIQKWDHDRSTPYPFSSSFRPHRTDSTSLYSTEAGPVP